MLTRNWKAAEWRVECCINLTSCKEVTRYSPAKLASRKVFQGWVAALDAPVSTAYTTQTKISIMHMYSFAAWQQSACTVVSHWLVVKLQTDCARICRVESTTRIQGEQVRRSKPDADIVTLL